MPPDRHALSSGDQRRAQSRRPAPQQPARCAQAHRHASPVQVFSPRRRHRAVQHRLVRGQRATLLQAGLRHRGHGLRRPVRLDGPRHHRRTGHELAPDRHPRRAGDDPGRRRGAARRQRHHHAAFADGLARRRRVRGPDVLLQHLVPRDHGELGEPRHRPAPRDRGLRLLGVRVFHADDRLAAGPSHHAPVPGPAPAVGRDHAGDHDCDIRGVDALPAFGGADGRGAGIARSAKDFLA